MFFGLQSMSLPGMPAHAQSQQPAQSITIAVRDDARKNFIDQLEQYASANFFEFSVAMVRPDHRYAIEMYRADLHILAVNSVDREAFRLHVLVNRPGQVSPKAIDAIVQEIKRRVARIPGVAIETARESPPAR